MTVTVTWGASPDLDLHVFEPSSHVWSVNRAGNNGILGTADPNGGPEYYYSGCTLETGDYIIKLNYVTGTGHEYPVVTVTAGSEFYQTKLDLESASGSSGNNNPLDGVCTIKVA